MKQLNDNKPYNKHVPLDNECDYTFFVRAICSYLQLRDERLNGYFSGIPTHGRTVLPDLEAVSSRLQVQVHRREIGHVCVFVYSNY